MTGQLQGSKPPPRNLTRTRRAVLLPLPAPVLRIRRMQAFLDAKNQGSALGGGLLDVGFLVLQSAKAAVQLEFALGEER